MPNMNVRNTSVAGTFYPADKKTLVAVLDSYISKSHSIKKAKGIVMPHAGYIYSGKTAGMTIRDVEVPETVLLLGPNHRGNGADFAVMSKGAWHSPIGNILIDEDFAAELLQTCDVLSDDESAHDSEHSLEVQVPFLQYKNSAAKIVPLLVNSYDIHACSKVAHAIAECIKDKDVLMLASSDMTHYESQVSAKAKDSQAIDAILLLDEELLLERVSKLRISMCGFLPVYIMLKAAKQLGSKHAFLVDYSTSGDMTGTYSQVVGYAGIVVE
jgi:MEMO1 family protein